ncbi:hypothetical protein KWE35_18110, partial [Acinetobacter baumannii]
KCHFVCLTARGLDTILCLLATLPVGFSRPFRKALKEQSFSDEPSCPLCGGMICPHKVGQLVKQFL